MIKRDIDGAESLQLSLTAEQGNLVIAALAECPFKLVYDLIGKLNRQANAAAQSDAALACPVGAAELKLILDALGQLPYQQVHALVHELQRQLQAQLKNPPREATADAAARNAGAANTRKAPAANRKAGKR
ncbi:MAG TPA: hypothetical protein VGN04_16545 [Herbaspirillum sp.]|jgi:hypothetical protein